MALIDEIANLPDVSFIDGVTLGDIQQQMVQDYLDKYEELTGESTELTRADPVSLILYACSVQIFQAMLYVDRAGKQDLLKYSYGEFLDNLAALKGIAREPAKPAVVTMRFSLAAIRPDTVAIPQGTRVSNGDLYFETDEYTEIPSGDTYVDVTATCQTDGEDGNGLLPGEINVLVDPIAYVASVANTESTVGGTDIEDDDTLASRVYIAPSKYSVAGPEEAYRYWITEFNSSISDVYLSSPEAGQVLIEFILENGELPNEAMVRSLADYLANENIRPLTDEVIVQIPATTTFNVNVQYWINRSDINKAATIQAAVEQAVTDYVSWQQSKIGRDINPDKLISLMEQAGAKRVAVTEPVFSVMPDATIGRIGTKTVSYGGIEND